MSITDTRNEKIISHLNHICKEWLYYEKIGETQNRPVGIKIRDDDAELLTDYVFDVRGTGSKSHGYDHTDGTETKVINLFQPKFCRSGGKRNNKHLCKAIDDEHKLHYKTSTCDLCGCSNFKDMEDSRAGIDSSAHFKSIGIIPRYVIWILFSENNVVNLKGYIVDAKNKFLNEILEEQLKYGSKPTKNFMPYSIDWYFSNPLLFAQYKFDIINDVYEVKPIFFDIENPISEKIYLRKKLNPLQKYVFKNKQELKESIYTILGDKEEYDYSEFYENGFVTLNWESSMGKIRGETQRRKLNNDIDLIIEEVIETNE